MVVIVRRIILFFVIVVREEGGVPATMVTSSFTLGCETDTAFSYVRSEQNGTVTCVSEQFIQIASDGRHPFLFLTIPLVFGVKLNRRLREYRAENSKINIADQRPWRIATSPLFVFQFSLDYRT